MNDFKNLLNPYANAWVVSAPRRARRPNQSKGTFHECPFDPGKEGEEKELYRVPLTHPESFTGDAAGSDWLIRVIPNKFPFAQYHEVLILTPQHGGGFDTWTEEHIVQVLETYRNRIKVHQDHGQVYLFHNAGERAGESIGHPHSQLVVIPFEVTPQIPRLTYLDGEETIDTQHFQIFCPKTTQWPDEVWVKAKNEKTKFFESTNEEFIDLARIMKKLIRIYDLRYERIFPYNFYIYPGNNWYIRIIPRIKILGGFEVGTGIFVNTQDPKETYGFIKEHFNEPNLLHIKLQFKADYHHTA